MSDQLHVIEFTEVGWELTHADDCEEEECPTLVAVATQLTEAPPHLLTGRHPCRVDDEGKLVIEDRLAWGDDDPRVDLPVLTTRVNRLGRQDVDPREVRPEGWGRSR